MAENNRNRPDQKDRRSGDYLPPRAWILWIVIIGTIPLLFFFKDRVQQNIQQWNYIEFKQAFEAGAIEAGKITFYPQSPDRREVTGKFRKRADGGKSWDKDPKTGEATPYKGAWQNDPTTGKEALFAFRTKEPLTDEFQEKLLASGFETDEPNTMLLGFLYSLLPFVLIVGLIYFFLIRQIRSAGKGALSFGKSKARMLSKEKNKVTFKDVAGVEEAKEEVSELVEFLKDPKKFQRLGGRIPKGILMIGPPGTGKTLIAKAIAGEADASFFTISGSDFVEMFVGVGASRVRDMFEQARKATPCLIFIDEIDAVGRSRGVGMGGGNDEREQTLNALLVEMDGFDTQEGIIIIAATNRPDVLDPALLRPGRFDRQVSVSLPDVKGREAILKVHAKNIKLEPAANLSVIARGTPGFSGAELANLLNEAALLAARTNMKAVGMTELEEARDKVRWGRERRSMAMSEEEKQTTAWHEGGHALVNVLLDHTHPLHKVTIIPRGQAYLGAAMFLPERDVLAHKRKECLDQITVMVAGRIAEEIITDDISSGASSDIQQATNMARSMICSWGMSEKMGMVQYGSEDEYYMGRDMGRRKDYSEQTALEIDAEVRRIIDDSCHRAEKLISANRDKLELIAKALLEYETLDGGQVADIVRTGRFDPPAPESRQVDPPTGAQAATTLPEVVKPKPPELPGLGTPAPSPA